LFEFPQEYKSTEVMNTAKTQMRQKSTRENLARISNPKDDGSQ
jgi:hypothetical protein